MILARRCGRPLRLGWHAYAVHAERVVGEREQRVVAGGVPVRPELRALLATLGEKRADAPHLLRAPAVLAGEASGETAVLVALERRADDVVDREEPCERQEVGVERGRGEHDGVPQLSVAPETRGRVLAQARRRHLRGVPGAELLDLRGRQAGERRARERLQRVAVSADEASRKGQWTTQQRGREPEPGGPAQEGKHAVFGRQGAVDVEHRDGRARVGARFWHGRTRLYTRGVSDGPEIFDDLYLGLQAGGALRKQRRGEELTEQEREAIGRWQQMAMWRKGVAIGAFAVGTFGLGFTIGGLIFGRWRKA